MNHLVRQYYEQGTHCLLYTSLLYALGEVVGNRADKHTLGESANLARRNETVHLGIDRCRDILTKMYIRDSYQIG